MSKTAVQIALENAQTIIAAAQLVASDRYTVASLMETAEAQIRNAQNGYERECAQRNEDD